MPKILIVEDMPDSAELAAQILRKFGHEPLIADSGERGLRLAEEHNPDLIVYDYWLPDIDARSFLTRLRSIESLASVPVVVCTATPTAAMNDVLGEKGFDAIIRKPYRLSNFLEVIEGQLKAND
ncbi:MAG: response regulator [Anaerolineales bacterium]